MDKSRTIIVIFFILLLEVVIVQADITLDDSGTADIFKCTGALGCDFFGYGVTNTSNYNTSDGKQLANFVLPASYVISVGAGTVRDCGVLVLTCYKAVNGTDGSVISGIDASTVVQSIINARISDFSITFKQGNYTSFSIKLGESNSNIVFKSEGYKAAKLTASGSQTTPIINISCSSGTLACSDNVIEDFWLDGSNNSQIDIINIDIGRKNQIRHNYFNNVAATAINVSGTPTMNPYETKVERNNIDNLYSWSYGTKCAIYFDSNSHDSFLTENVINRFRGNGACGLYLGGNSHYISGEHYWDIYKGIIIDGGDDNKIVGVYMDGTGDEAIYITNSAHSNIVTNSQFYKNNESFGTDNYNPAINISVGTSNIVKDNILDNYGSSTVGYFVNISANSNDNHVYDNICRGAGGLPCNVTVSNLDTNSIDIPVISSKPGDYNNEYSNRTEGRMALVRPTGNESYLVINTKIASGNLRYAVIASDIYMISPITAPTTPLNGSMFWNGSSLCIYVNSTTKKCAQFS